ncbi:hypothetical protein [Anaplasma bovis]|uniref:hypothetical protein n=1 Tax=Anaplasma bovis TaxID=186733 RepID=UPI002FEF8DA8
MRKRQYHFHPWKNVNKASAQSVGEASLQILVVKEILVVLQKKEGLIRRCILARVRFPLIKVWAFRLLILFPNPTISGQRTIRMYNGFLHGVAKSALLGAACKSPLNKM